MSDRSKTNQYLYSEAEFAILVEEGLARLPERIRQRMANVAVTLERRVSSKLRQEMRLSRHDDLLGLYQGVPLTERGAGYSSLPDKITLFQEPIERTAGPDREAIRQTVYDTVWHEVAHHFGMEEAEVRQREKLPNHACDE